MKIEAFIKNTLFADVLFLHSFVEKNRWSMKGECNLL